MPSKKKIKEQQLLDLIDAVRNRSADEVQKIIDTGIDLNAKHPAPQAYFDEWSALHWASDKGRLDIVKILLKADVNVNSQAKDGCTPLHWAAGEGHFDVTKALLDGGADMNILEQNGMNTLHYVAHYCMEDGVSHLQVLQLLLELGADVSAVEESGKTALHLASFRGNTRMARVLLENKADPNRQSKDGSTPIHEAVSKGFLEMTRTLLEFKADVNIRDASDHTPLLLAVDNEDSDLVSLLVSHGADVDVLEEAQKELVHEMLASNTNPAAVEPPVGMLDDTAGREAPSPLVDLGPEHVEIYHRACKSGTMRVYRMRVMFVGHFGVGKTWLRKNLIGDEYSAEEHGTTNGIEADPSWCRIHIDQRKLWNIEHNKDVSGGNSIDEYNAAVARACVQEMEERRQGIRMEELNINETILKSSSEPVTSDSAEFHSGCEFHNPQQPVSASDGENIDLHPSTNTPTNAKLKTIDVKQNHVKNGIPEDVKMKIAAMVAEKERGVLDDETKILSFWDFGGQHVFYTTHQTFLTNRAVYILVFNLSLGLDEPVEAMVQTSFGAQKDEMAPKTVREYLDYWLNSIHMYGTRGADNSTHYPPVIIVGTHKDQLDPDPRERRKKINARFCEVQQYLRSKAGHDHHVHPVYFAIDNTSKQDPELRKLQNTIMEVAKQQPHWGEERPLRWIKLEERLKTFLKNNEDSDSVDQINEKVLLLSKVYQLAKEVGICDEDEVLTFLLFSHSLGDLIYFDDEELRDYVILDPQWLIDAFKSVITVQKYHKQRVDHRGDWEKLETTGIISEDFIMKIWETNPSLKDNARLLLLLMLKFDLICPKTPLEESCFSGGYYYVPCHLRLAHAEDWAEMKANCSVPGIHFTFDSKFLPNGVYYRLVTRCLHHWQSPDNELYFNSAIFYLRESDTAVILTRSEYAIQVQVMDPQVQSSHSNCADNPTPQSPNPLYVQIREFIEDSLYQIIQNYCPRLSFHTCVQVEGLLFQVCREDILEKERVTCRAGLRRKQIRTKPYKIWFDLSEKAGEQVDQYSEHLKHLLIRKRTYIVKNLDRIPDILDYLQQELVFTPDQCEKIGNLPGTRRDKVRLLLDMLATSGSDAIPVFIAALRFSECHDVADMLEPPYEIQQFQG